MKLISVNVAKPKTVAGDRGDVSTGIFKIPVAGRVALRTLNLDGDGQADLVNHGGTYKACPSEHYAYWKETLGRVDLAWGQFGENLTVEGMTETDVCVGGAFLERLDGFKGDVV